jgi:hypothetical protein
MVVLARAFWGQELEGAVQQEIFHYILFEEIFKRISSSAELNLYFPIPTNTYKNKRYKNHTEIHGNPRFEKKSFMIKGQNRGKKIEDSFKWRQTKDAQNHSRTSLKGSEWWHCTNTIYLC